MGSPFIPYISDDSSDKSSSTDKPSQSVRDNSSNECKGYAMIYYVGGHKAWPKPVNTMIFVYDDRIELGAKQETPALTIPYAKIKNIENMGEQKISAERVIGLGLVFVPLAIVGAVWKKRHIYTVIRYKDELDDQTVVLDFEDNIDKFQPFIYRKVMELKKG
ncbi:MAG: hypothetical protein WBQ16_11995 [Nitrososphaeraceae archaeon]